MATLSLQTGAAYVQTYPTREELIALAEMCLDMAGAMEPAEAA
jgi:hypothetical protein